MTSDELQNWLKAFDCRTIPLCESLPSKKISENRDDQLLRSAFSAAANYSAACKGQPGKIPKAKISIAFEEIDKALFWLEVINDLKLVSFEKRIAILKEAEELIRILATIRSKL